MIKIIIGDLLGAKEDIIVHQVNCQSKMNSGIAKQIREKYPQAYDDYMRVNDKPSKLGHVKLTMIKNKDGCKYIANLFGQERYGYDGKRYTNYEAIYSGLEYIKNIAQKHNKSIAIPFKIGSDRGGADWRIIEKMIEVIFEDYEVTLYKLGSNHD